MSSFHIHPNKETVNSITNAVPTSNDSVPLVQNPGHPITIIKNLKPGPNVTLEDTGELINITVNPSAISGIASINNSDGVGFELVTGDGINPQILRITTAEDSNIILGNTEDDKSIYIDTSGSVVTGPDSSKTNNLAVFANDNGNTISDSQLTLPPSQSGTDGQVLSLQNSTDGQLAWVDNSGGNGDVVGPTTSKTNYIPIFSDETGKVLKESTAKISNVVLEIEQVACKQELPTNTDFAEPFQINIGVETTASGVIGASGVIEVVDSVEKTTTGDNLKNPKTTTINAGSIIVASSSDATKTPKTTTIDASTISTEYLNLRGLELGASVPIENKYSLNFPDRAPNPGEYLVAVSSSQLAWYQAPGPATDPIILSLKRTSEANLVEQFGTVGGDPIQQDIVNEVDTTASSTNVNSHLTYIHTEGGQTTNGLGTVKLTNGFVQGTNNYYQFLAVVNIKRQLSGSATIVFDLHTNLNSTNDTNSITTSGDGSWQITKTGIINVSDQNPTTNDVLCSFYVTPRERTLPWLQGTDSVVCAVGSHVLITQLSVGI